MKPKIKRSKKRILTFKKKVAKINLLFIIFFVIFVMSKVQGMNINKETNPVSRSLLGAVFSYSIADNFGTGFLNMETKICSKCKIEKTINKFYKNKNLKDGLSSWCKECKGKAGKEYYKKNRDEILEYQKKYPKEHNEAITKKRKEYQKEYHKRHIEKRNKRAREIYRVNIIQRKEYIAKNKDKIKHNRKKYYQKNINKFRCNSKIYYRNNAKKYKQYNKNRRDDLNKWQKEKYKNDPIFRLKKSMSTNIYHSLKENKNSQSWEKLVGYTCQDLKKHLESQFKEGMTWENYGKWQIDHRVPISLFNITSTKCKGFRACWKLENLQPLWAKENRNKSNKLFI